MIPNAPYTGGYATGAQLFAVDGDFTQCDPCSLPEISYAVKGDSVLSTGDIVVFYPTIPIYSTVRLGNFPNIAPWSANQVAAVLEQEFMVALSAYLPMRLNTPYDPDYALGSVYAGAAWQGQFPDGTYTFNLEEFILVEEGELHDMGGGICKLKRKFAILPPTRSEIEQYVVTFPGIADSDIGLGNITRIPFTRNVMTRIQYDYFVFDDWNVLGDSPYIYFQLFPDSDFGRRLNADTGLYPNGLILQPTQWFGSSSVYTLYGNFVGPQVESLSDGAGDPDSATMPSSTNYLQWCSGENTSNGAPAEIIVESSTFTRYMGNIWERRTRFCQAQ